MYKPNLPTSDDRDSRKENDASKPTSDRRETRSLSPKLKDTSGLTERQSQRPQSAKSSPIRKGNELSILNESEARNDVISPSQLKQTGPNILYPQIQPSVCPFNTTSKKNDCQPTGRESSKILEAGNSNNTPTVDKSINIELELLRNSGPWENLGQVFQLRSILRSYLMQFCNEHPYEIPEINYESVKIVYQKKVLDIQENRKTLLTKLIEATNSNIHILHGTKEEIRRVIQRDFNKVTEYTKKVERNYESAIATYEANNKRQHLSRITKSKAHQVWAPLMGKSRKKSMQDAQGSYSETQFNKYLQDQNILAGKDKNSSNEISPIAPSQHQSLIWDPNYDFLDPNKSEPTNIELTPKLFALRNNLDSVTKRLSDLYDRPTLCKKTLTNTFNVTPVANTYTLNNLSYNPSGTNATEQPMTGRYKEQVKNVKFGNEDSIKHISPNDSSSDYSNDNNTSMDRLLQQQNYRGQSMSELRELVSKLFMSSNQLDQACIRISHNIPQSPRQLAEIEARVLSLIKTHDKIAQDMLRHSNIYIEHTRDKMEDVTSTERQVYEVLDRAEDSKRAITTLLGHIKAALNSPLSNEDLYNVETRRDSKSCASTPITSNNHGLSDSAFEHGLLDKSNIRKTQKRSQGSECNPQQYDPSKPSINTRDKSFSALSTMSNLIDLSEEDIANKTAYNYDHHLDDSMCFLTAAGGCPIKGEEQMRRHIDYFNYSDTARVKSHPNDCLGPNGNQYNDPNYRNGPKHRQMIHQNLENCERNRAIDHNYLAQNTFNIHTDKMNKMATEGDDPRIQLYQPTINFPKSMSHTNGNPMNQIHLTKGDHISRNSQTEDFGNIRSNHQKRREDNNSNNYRSRDGHRTDKVRTRRERHESLRSTYDSSDASSQSDSSGQSSEEEKGIKKVANKTYHSKVKIKSLIADVELLKRSNKEIQRLIEEHTGLAVLNSHEITDLLRSKERNREMGDRNVVRANKIYKDYCNIKHYLKKTDIKNINRALKESEQLDLELSNSLRDLKMNSKERRINLNKVGSGLSEHMHYPTFTGQPVSMGNIHLYEWIDKCMEIFSTMNIPKDHRGAILKQYLTPEARNAVEDSIEKEDEVINALKNKYGNIFEIHTQISNLHNEIGEIPMAGEGTPSQLRERSRKADKHFHLLKRAEILLKFDRSNQLKDHLKGPANAARLRNFLPHDERCKLKDIEIQDPDLAYDLVRKSFDKLHSESSLIHAKFDTKESKKDNLKKTHVLYTSEHPECFICTKLKSQGKMSNYFINHEFTNKGSTFGNKCPNYLKLGMQGRNNLFADKEICRYDLCPSDVNHRYPFEQCKNKILKTNKKPWTCKEPECPERKDVCLQHFEQNKPDLERHANNLAKKNVHFVIACISKSEAPITALFTSSKNMDDRPLIMTNKELMEIKGVDKNYERKGTPLLLFMLLKGASRPLSTIFDTACSTTLMKENVPGIQLFATPTKEHDTILEGIGGSRPAVASYKILVPLKSRRRRYAPLEGYAVPRIVNPIPQLDIRHGIELIKRTYPNDDAISQAKIYPKMGGSVDLLIGIKYQNIFPTLIHETNCGLGIYSLILQSHNPDHNMCLGGNLREFARLEDQFGNRMALLSTIQEGLEDFRKGSIPKIDRYCIYQKVIGKGAQQLATKASNIDECRSLGKALVQGGSHNNNLHPDINTRKVNAINRTCQTHKETTLWCSSLNNIVATDRDADMAITPPLPKKPSNISFIKKLSMLINDDQSDSVCPNCKQEEKFERISMIELREESVLQGSIWLDNGSNRFIARLPVLGDPMILLDDNCKETAKSVRSNLRKLKDKPNDKEEVLRSFRKLTDKNFIIRLDQLEHSERVLIDSKRKYYIPFTIAYKESSASTPVRLCFDASRKTSSGKSLNEILPRGKFDLALDRLAVNFALRQIALVGDISKFYNSFNLHPDDYNLQLFLWQDDLEPEGELTCYVIKTLIYGIRSVARQSEIALEILNEEYKEKDKEFSRLLTLCRYVDDLGTSLDSKADAISLRDRTDSILRSVGLNVKGWVISGDHPGTNSEISTNGIVTITGYNWWPLEDTISIRVPPIHFSKKKKGKILTTEIFEGETLSDLKEFVPNEITLRQISGRLSSIYDVRGIISPLISGIKTLLSDTMAKCLGIMKDCDENSASAQQWDCVIPQDLRTKWIEALWAIEQVKPLRFPRHNFRGNYMNKEGHLHIFVDASGPPNPKLQQVSYISFQSEGGPWISTIMCARNQLGKKDRTVPKQELESCAKGAEMAEYLSKYTAPYVKAKSLYTDSSVVCHWLLNETKDLAIFERRRISTIRHVFNVDEIFHIGSKDNPSDLGTRTGVKVEDVGPDSQFYRGPDYLNLGLEEMVRKKIVTPAKEIVINRSSIDYLDGLKLPTTHTVAITNSIKVDSLKKRLEFSDYLINPMTYGWRKGVKIMAIVLRFISKLLIRLESTKFNKKSIKIQYRIYERIPEDLIPSELIIGGMQQITPKNILLDGGRHNRNTFLKVMGSPHKADKLTIVGAWYFLSKGNKEAKTFCKSSVLSKHAKEVGGILVDNHRMHNACSIIDLLETNQPVPELGIRSKALFLDSNSPVAIAIAIYIHEKIAIHRGGDFCTAISLNHVYIYKAQELFQEISRSCINCKRKNRKRMKIHFGPLNESQLTIGAVFNTLQMDMSGPYLVKTHQYAKNTRRRQSLIKVYLLHAVCSMSHLSKTLILEDYSVDGFLSALQSLCCEFGTPRTFLIDPSSTEISALTKSNFQLIDLSSRAYHELGVDVRLCPVGGSSHYRHGLIERRIGLIKKALEYNLKCTQNLTIIGFQRALECIDNTLNSTPLGFSNKYGQSSASRLITPNHFKIGRSNTRALARNIEYPSSRGMVLDGIKTVTNALIKYILNRAIPQLLLKPIWLKESYQNISIGDIVLFKKLDTGISQEWHLGKITEAHEGKDKSVRVVQVTYSNSSEVSLPLTKTDITLPKVNKRFTNRSTRQIVKLYSIDDPDINDDIHTISNWQKNNDEKDVTDINLTPTQTPF